MCKTPREIVAVARRNRRLGLIGLALIPFVAMTLRSAFTLAAGVALAFVAGIIGFGQAVAELKVGDEAPAFNLPGSDGKSHRLADYKGKSAVVLAWFPKAFTGG